MDSKSAASKRDVKKGLNTDDSRRRREESTIKLRKEKKEEGLAKRRNLNMVEDAGAFSDTPQDAASGAANSQVPLSSDSESLQRFLDQLVNGDIATQINALRSFRRLLSLERNPPVQQIVDLGVLPLFVQALQRIDSQELQFEAAWALTNIASTDRTHLVVDHNAVGPLVALLTSSSADIREQSAWCLGNIAGDSAVLRDIVLAHGALQPLLANISQPETLTLLRNCTWTLSNFCRGKPQPKLEVVLPAMPVLAQLINSRVDPDTMIDAAWAVSYLTDGGDERIQPFVELKVLPTLVDMMTSSSSAVVTPALRAIGNVVSGSDSQTQAVLDAKALHALLPLLSHAKKSIRKETCWVLSNIAAGTAAQLNSLFLVPDLLSQVLNQLQNGEWEVRKEASWIVCNITTSESSNSDHLSHLLQIGVMRPLSALLTVSDVKVIIMTLDAIEAFFKMGMKINQLDDIIRMFDEVDGIENLESLQEHQNQKVYEKALAMLTTYFSQEEEAECEENIAPAHDGNQFAFGLPAANSKQTGFVNTQQPLVNQHFHF